MHTADLIAAIAKRAGTTQKAAGAFLDAFKAEVSSALQAGSSVTLTGFGTFEVRSRRARNGTRPGTNETIIIPAKRVPAFKAGKGLKDAIR